MLEIMSNLRLSFKTIKKSPVVWFIPLLFMVIFWLDRFFPLIIVHTLFKLETDLIGILVFTLKAILVFMATSLVLVLIIFIFKRVFDDNLDSVWIFVKKNIFLTNKMMGLLLPINIVILFLFIFFTSQLFFWYLWRGFLLAIKNIFLYYALCGVTRNEVKNNRSFFLKNIFTGQIVFQLIIVSLLIGIFTAPLLFVTSNEILNPFHPTELNFLYLFIAYRNPAWFELLRSLYEALVQSFLFLYAVVIYYRKNQQI